MPVLDQPLVKPGSTVVCCYMSETVLQWFVLMDKITSTAIREISARSTRVALVSTVDWVWLTFSQDRLSMGWSPSHAARISSNGYNFPNSAISFQKNGSKAALMRDVSSRVGNLKSRFL